MEPRGIEPLTSALPGRSTISYPVRLRPVFSLIYRVLGAVGRVFILLRTVLYDPCCSTVAVLLPKFGTAAEGVTVAGLPDKGRDMRDPAPTSSQRDSPLPRVFAAHRRRAVVAPCAQPAVGLLSRPPVQGPLPDVVVDGPPSRILSREHLPSATGAEKVEDSVGDAPGRPVGRTTTPLGGGEKRFQQGPFGVWEIRRVGIMSVGYTATAESSGDDHPP